MQRLPADDVPDCRRPADPALLERIEKAVAAFPPEWRQVWDLWVQGRSREEMAHAAGKSVRTSHYWLAEMLDRLQEGVGE
jgi:DNA-directed RNA polymerase specialized sigma24 family protein